MYTGRYFFRGHSVYGLWNASELWHGMYYMEGTWNTTKKCMFSTLTMINAFDCVDQPNFFPSVL